VEHHQVTLTVDVEVEASPFSEIADSLSSEDAQELREIIDSEFERVDLKGVVIESRSTRASRSISWPRRPTPGCSGVVVCCPKPRSSVTVDSTKPGSWPWSLTADSIVRIRQLACTQRQASAPDAVSETHPQPFEVGDPFVHPGEPHRRQLRPVGSLRRPPARQLVEESADFLQAHSDALGKNDERHLPQSDRRVPAVAGRDSL
jgi:hypothetical protein